MNLLKYIYHIFKDSSEIFLEASLIPLFITLSYFLVFIAMEEKIILKQIKIGIEKIAKEIYIIAQSYPNVSKNKESLIESIKNLDTNNLDDNELTKKIEENNDFYYKKSLTAVGLYSTVMFLLSLLAWYLKNNGFEVKKYLICIAYPSILAAALIILVETLFIAFIMGNFMPIDSNSFMREFITRIYQVVEYAHNKDLEDNDNIFIDPLKTSQDLFVR